MRDDESASEIERLRGENARFLRDRRRTLEFLGSEAWAAMNARRAELIDRDVSAKDLLPHESAELATLQAAVDVLIDIPHPSPLDDMEPLKDRLIELLTAERDGYQAELATLRGEIVEAAGIDDARRAGVRLYGIADRIREGSRAEAKPDV